MAAARRYEDLRYGDARHDGAARADIPQRIFEEFYARQEDVEHSDSAPDRRRLFRAGFGV